MNKIYGFDLDGTLVDSMPTYSKGILKLMDDREIAYGPELIEILTPLGYTKSAEYYRQTYHLPETTEELVREIEGNLYPLYATEVMTKPYLKEYLEQLKKEGAILFVLTASPHEATDPCLKNNGVFDLFDHIWSVEDFKMSKSTPEVFLHVAKILGVRPEEITFFEDSQVAITNATKAGLNTVAVRDHQKEEIWQEIKATGKHSIESYKEAFEL